MKLKKLILNIVLSICSVFVRLRPIRKDQIAFVSLESKALESDLKLIHDALEGRGYRLVNVLTSFEKNSLWMNLLYFLNTIRQIFVINTSALVIISDNNYVISRFKRKGVKVLQVWHAAGAIKKFGNAIHREYPIANYDQVICNGAYWKKPYSEAFNVSEEQVSVTGMPRLDHLLDDAFIRSSREKLFAQHPEWKGKKLLLYAPTFRGNIYEGMKQVPIDLHRLMKKLGSGYALLYKLHPLLKHEELSDDRNGKSGFFILIHHALHGFFQHADEILFHRDRVITYDICQMIILDQELRDVLRIVTDALQLTGDLDGCDDLAQIAGYRRQQRQ